MNEKIKQLLPNPFTVDYSGPTEPIDLYTEKEMVKFAKLIIKECLDEFPVLTMDDPNWSYDAMVFNSIVREKIQKRFGIE